MPDAGWKPAFACPECETPIANAQHGESSTAALICSSCSQEFACRDDIYRFLPDDRLAELEPALAQYRRVRERDGHRLRGAAYYRSLPFVDRDDPEVSVWRVRHQSFRNLCAGILRKRSQRVLELGAGNCWLTNRMTQLGHRCVALDVLDDSEDGLGCAGHYTTSFIRLQADFDRLPLMHGQFDVVIFNASLHYSSNPAATLGHAGKALAPGGTLVVMDSPVFVDETDGRRMVADRQRHFSDFVDSPVEWGIGFLSVGVLERAATEAGVEVRRIGSRGGARWAIKRWIAGQKLRRQPASFGIWAFTGVAP